MDIYKIVGKLVLEGKEQFNRDVEDAKSRGSSLASAIGSGLKTAAKIGVVAIGAATTAVTALTKTSLDSYAQYEQLVGGSKLLFGDAYDYIAEQAKTAYKDVQMSQNDYLQQVNGFATGLKTALGGNEQAAAELATKIIRAEADVVAATGNSQEAVQNAFNGIMKGNFTMLDNLQLGITPTKEGFQEVIDKVNEWNTANGNATKYQIDNLADCQSALVDYIEMQGLAGYAQAEAAETIQGSLSMVKASWQDLLTGLADESADIDSLIDNLVSSATTAARNITPRITQILNSMSRAVTQIAPVITNAIPVIVTDVLPNMASAGVQLLQSLLDVLSQNVDLVVSSGTEILMMLATALIDNLPLLVTVGMQVLTALIIGIAQKAPELVPAVIEGIVLAWQALIDAVPDFVEAGIDLIEGLADGLMEAFTALFPEVGPWVDQNIYQPIKATLGVALDIGRMIVGELWAGLREGANALFPGLGDLICGYTEDSLSASVDTMLSAGEKLSSNTKTLVGAIAERMENDNSMEVAAKGAVDKAASQMSDAVSTAGFDVSGQGAMNKFISGIDSKTPTMLSRMRSLGQQMVSHLQSGFGSVSVSGYFTLSGGGLGPNGSSPSNEFNLNNADASAWRAGRTSGDATAPGSAEQQTGSHSGITIVQNIQAVPQTPVEFAAATEAYFEQARWAMG